MIIQLTTTQWLALPMEVRMKLKEVFGIRRSQGTVMQDNMVLSDGHTHNDLLAISVEKMQEYLGSKKQADFYKLFEATLEKLEGKQEVAKDPAPAGVQVTVVATEDMFITHNGKTYKLTEVVAPADSPKVADNAPVYPQGPKAPEAPAPARRTRAKRGAAKGAGK